MSPEGASELLAPQRLDVPGSDTLAARLFPPLPREVEWGLDRVRACLADLGDPHLAAPSLHVGGTNGKGSVAAILASVLGAHGTRVGLYTSPHLDSFRERYRVGSEPLSPAALEETARGIRDAVARHGLTFFEAATVLAFQAFRARDVGATVAEVGLGGRLDATNVLRPEVTVVTNVSLDHAEYLGSTLPEIAREKAGIAKRGVPFVTAEPDPEILGVLAREAEAAGAPIHRVDPAEHLVELDTTLEGTLLVLETDAWGRLELRAPLPGRHQAVNVALAVRALELLDPPLRPDAGAVTRGVAGVRWPGRLQVERMRGRTWIFDVAHNAAGVRALSAALRELAPPRPWAVVVAILGDKSWRQMLPPLFEPADRVILTQTPTAPEHRRWDPAEALGALGSPDHASIVPDLEAALDAARAAASPDGTVIVTGSHYTVGAALRALGRPPFRPGA